MTHTTEQERELFEAFASDNGKWMKSIERDAHGNYRLLTTSAGWMWWQAARQAAQVEVAELKGRIARAGVEQRRAVREAVLQEREACAEACDDVDEPAYYGYVNPNCFDDGRRACAAAIRARQ